MGGGKTHISCVAMIIRRLQFPSTMGLMLRRVRQSADLNLGEKIKQIIQQWGLPYGRIQRGEIQWQSSDKLFRFPNGSIIQLGYCDNPNDWERYWGPEYADICFEEATNFPEITYTNLASRNRSANAACHPKRWATSNPGGQYDEWYFRRFVNEHTRDQRTIWIPSTLDDAPALLERDPGYAERIRRTQPDWRYKQWRKGIWNVIAGSYFTVPPSCVRYEEPPYWAEWYAGIDWGHAHPFVCLFMARWKDFQGADRAHFYSEIYETGLEYPEQAQRVSDMERHLRETNVIRGNRMITYYADPATTKDVRGRFASRTTREMWREHGLFTFPARTNERVAGWRLLQTLLLLPNESQPTLTISPRCKMLLYELEKAVGEGAPGPIISEDIDHSPSVMDHALDAARYVLVSTFRLGYKPEAIHGYANI